MLFCHYWMIKSRLGVVALERLQEILTLDIPLVILDWFSSTVFYLFLYWVFHTSDFCFIATEKRFSIYWFDFWYMLCIPHFNCKCREWQVKIKSKFFKFLGQKFGCPSNVSLVSFSLKFHNHAWGSCWSRQATCSDCINCDVCMRSFLCLLQIYL